MPVVCLHVAIGRNPRLQRSSDPRCNSLNLLTVPAPAGLQRMSKMLNDALIDTMQLDEDLVYAEAEVAVAVATSRQKSEGLPCEQVDLGFETAATHQPDEFNPAQIRGRERNL